MSLSFNYCALQKHEMNIQSRNIKRKRRKLKEVMQKQNK